MAEIFTADELEGRLRKIGAERYHNLHPFHKMLHGGKMNFGQVQAWALNRYAYQAAIPRKDAALISRLHERRRHLQRNAIRSFVADARNLLRRRSGALTWINSRLAFLRFSHS